MPSFFLSVKTVFLAFFTRQRLRFFFFALSIHSLLFFAFPVYQYFNTRYLSDGERKQSEVVIKTIRLKEEKKEKKKIKLKSRPQERKEFKRPNDGRFKVKFGLGAGTGASLIQSDTGAMVYGEGEVDKEPVPLFKVIPEKPFEAERAGVGGRVEVRLLVSELGQVIQAEVTQGVEGYGLNEAALEAARRWTFEPAMVKGLPVRYWVTIPFNFPQ